MQERQNYPFIIIKIYKYSYILYVTIVTLIRSLTEYLKTVYSDILLLYTVARQFNYIAALNFIM